MSLRLKFFWKSFCISVFIIAIFLRVFKLGSIPYGIALDEANYGYDAFSIGKDGKDMWGKFGSSLRAFGEYKPIGLTLTLVPIIEIFGLNTFSTRLPSAIFGILTLLITYQLIKYLTKSKIIAFISMLILSLSPWHFGLSRQYYESVTGLFFIATSIYFQLRYIRKPNYHKYLLISSLLAGLAGYYYQVLRYLGIGLIGIAIVIANKPDIKRIAKNLIYVISIWGIVMLPILGDVFSSTGFIRLTQEHKARQFGDVLVITEQRQMCYLSSEKNPIITKACYGWWNKPGEVIINTTKHYIELISPSYLFNENNQSDTISQDNGAYLEIVFVFYLLGLYYLSKRSRENVHLYILSAYLFSIIPIALSYSTGIQRNVVGLYMVTIIVAYGMMQLNDLTSKLAKSYKTIIFIIISLCYLWLQSRYIANYYLAYTKFQPEVWHSGVPELMTWLYENNNGREIIFSSDTYSSMYYAFFSKFDPVEFRNQSIWDGPDDFGVYTITGINGTTRNEVDLIKTICAHKDAEIKSSLLVISGNKPEWNPIVLKEVMNFTRIHILYEVYDSQSLFEFGVCNPK